MTRRNALRTPTGTIVTVTFISDEYGIVLVEWPSGGTQEYSVDPALARVLSKIEQ
jgi:hypothetical protein